MYLRHTMRIQYSNCLPQGMLQQHIPTPVYSCILKPLSILFCKLLQIANIYTMSFLRTTLALTEGSSNLSFTKSLALMHIPCKWKHPDGLKLTSTTQAHIADHELTNPGIILGTLASAITARSTLRQSWSSIFYHGSIHYNANKNELPQQVVIKFLSPP